MQHMSILPMAAQIEVKSGTLVGTGDAAKGRESDLFSSIYVKSGNMLLLTDCTVQICHTENIDVAAVGSARSTNCSSSLTSHGRRGNRAGDEAAKDEESGE